MKCEVCLELLEEYIDGELSDREANEVAAHLITCSSCSTERSVLGAEQEIYARYDRELEVPLALWGRIAEQTVSPVVGVPVSEIGFATRIVELFKVPAFGFGLATAALIVIAILVGSVYVRLHKQQPEQVTAGITTPTPDHAPEDTRPKVEPDQTTRQPLDEKHLAINKPKPKRGKGAGQTAIDQTDVLSSDLGYADIDDQDTAKHLEQTQNLLRSIRNVQLNDGNQEIDVTYDKALSRRLLNENIVLRRDAEMKAKFPTKALLSDLEPFLIDIANLPDQAKPEDVRAIKERVKKTEIVAALIGFE